MPTAETLLIFRIAGIACAVPAETVGSIVMPPGHLTHPPGSDRSTPGIFHHAEFTYSVIDLHARFGIDAPRKGSGRLLLQDEGMRHFAFLIDEVVGLVRSEEGKWATLPPYLPQNVFWSGFLYRKEIVLCTELTTLRTMRDASPLHRHIEALRQQAPARDAEEEKSPHPEEKPLEAPSGDVPVSDVSRTTARIHTTTRSSDTPAKTTASSLPSKGRAEETKPASAIIRPPATTSVNQPATGHRTPGAITERSPISRRAPERVSPGSVKKRDKPPVTPTPGPSSPPIPSEPVATELPPSMPGKSESSAFPLLLILLLAFSLPAVWWFWPQPESPAPAPPLVLQPEPVQVPTSRPEPEPAVTAVPETPPPTPSPSQPAPATVAPRAPLTIERDAEGTINLIIDRQAITSSAPVPVLPTTEPKDILTDTEDTSGQATGEKTATAATSVETGTESDHAEQPIATAEQEPPLQPDPDWPKPASPTGLEPCDCTHTVVPGDTLWDIAEQYTGNAFNYHDLARRSGIRNPDRIYPGDTVRIIIR